MCWWELSTFAGDNSIDNESCCWRYCTDYTVSYTNGWWPVPIFPLQWYFEAAIWSWVVVWPGNVEHVKTGGLLLRYTYLQVFSAKQNRTHGVLSEFLFPPILHMPEFILIYFIFIPIHLWRAELKFLMNVLLPGNTGTQTFVAWDTRIDW